MVKKAASTAAPQDFCAATGMNSATFVTERRTARTDCRRANAMAKILFRDDQPGWYAAPPQMAAVVRWNLCARNAHPQSGRWIVDSRNEQQRAAAPVLDRTE